MTNWNLIIFLLLFLLYNYSMFNYVSFMYLPFVENWKIIFLTSIINCLMFIVPQVLHLDNITPIVTYLVCYSLQFNYIYKKNMMACFFLALIFTLNLYGIGLIVAGTISLIHSSSMAIQRAQPDIRMLTTIFSLLIAILQIWIVKSLFSKEKIDTLLSHKKSLQLSCKIMSIVFIYALIVIDIDNHQKIEDTRIAILNIKIGIVSMFGFILAVIYGYIFGMLNLHQKQFEKYETLVHEEEERINELNKTAEKDTFTGLYLKNVGLERINFYKNRKIQFYVIFIDMDGLKIVNDEYNHNEGDFYILNVTKILQSNFNSAIISRIGGDEFLIVGASQDVYEPTRNTITAYEEVKMIKSNYEKIYDTSISYGIVNIDETNWLNTENIIKLADERMYDFKKSKKKERAVTKIF
ncbi:hypothetical protein AN641_10105 [Candidatus Epulonipiscioides gigas]|nr:hypothetical protein AN641_10105 [Epulopiscium sp. SCG-C07WGA-EpuloA2]